MKKITIFLLGILTCLNITLACMNDKSSIHFEQQKFPQEEDLISGKFYIHSKSFHEWRIQDRLAKIEVNPNNPSLLDDLSVSYEKTGQIDKAIDTLQSVLEKYPNRYETLSNLGTFYIHHSEYEKGLVLLKKAISINPQAHYGREIYQIKVVEYIISLNKPKSLKFPLQNKDKDFSDFLLKDIVKENQKDESIKAIVGVSGMLKFGNSDSPILLEVLGDLYYRIYKDYTIYKPQYGNTHEQLLIFAQSFYVASYLRSGYKYFNIEMPTTFNNIDNNIELQLLKNQQTEYLHYKILIDFFNQKKISQHYSYETEIYAINSKIIDANKFKQRIVNNEEDIINKNNNPEKIIYTTLFPSQQIQKNLFDEKKNLIDKEINFGKKMWYKEKLDAYTILILKISVMLLYFTVFVSFILLNYLYAKYRNITISSYGKSILLSGMIFFNIFFILIGIVCTNNAIRFAYDPPIFSVEILSGLVIYTLIFLLFFIRTKFNLKNKNDLRLIKILKWYYIINLILFLIAIMIATINLRPSLSFTLKEYTNIVIFTLFEQ